MMNSTGKKHGGLAPITTTNHKKAYPPGLKKLDKLSVSIKEDIEGIGPLTPNIGQFKN